MTQTPAKTAEAQVKGGELGRRGRGRQGGLEGPHTVSGDAPAAATCVRRRRARRVARAPPSVPCLPRAATQRPTGRLHRTRARSRVAGMRREAALPLVADTRERRLTVNAVRASNEEKEGLRTLLGQAHHVLLCRRAGGGVGMPVGE